MFQDKTYSHTKNPRRSARYAEIILYEDPSGWQTFSYGKLGELTENIRIFALPFESQTYTFKMQYKYDPFNRIQCILYPDSELVEYSYNLGGMLSRVTGSVTRKTSDLVVPVLLQGGGLLQGGDGVQGLDLGGDHAVESTVTIRYPYLDSIVYNQFELKDSVVYGNGTRVRYVYDSLQRLTALRSYTADDELMQDIAYHYDSVGNILDIENSAAALGNGLGGTYRQEYTYDNLYRLTHATGWWECRPDHLTLRDTVDMSYSKNGRIIRKQTSAETLKNMQLNLVRYDREYQYPGSSNKVHDVDDAVSGASHLFSWDDCGNMVRHDNPEQGCDRRLSWTEDNRLQFVKDNGNTGAYYQYDAGGDRTYKLLYHKTTGSLNGVQTDYYTLDDATLYVSPYLVVTPQGYTKHYYAESERITTQLGKYRFAVVDSCVEGDSLVPIKLQDATRAFPTDSFPTPTPQLGYLHSLTNHPNTASSLYFYHPDHLGSASWITNIYGRTIQHLYYLPWGEDFVNQRTGSFSSMYTFSAKEKDTETGYSYFGARYYSSDLSIWLSVDPMAAKYPSLSPYTYCANNPVKLVDIDGCDWVLSTGNKVYWYAGDKGDRSTLLHTYNASSGNYDNDNDYRQAQYQNLRDKGPTPEGEYFINLKPDPERHVGYIGEQNPQITRSKDGGIEQVSFKTQDGTEWFSEEWGSQRALLQPVKVTGATSAERDNNSYYMHDSEKCFTHGCTEVESGFFEQLKTYRDEGNEKIDVVIEYPNAQHRTTSCKTNSDE